MKRGSLHFFVTRTQNIGDMIVTFPLFAKLKEYYPGCRITVLGRRYTESIVKRCPNIDAFITLEDLQALAETERIAYLQAQGFDVFLPVFPDKQQLRWGAQAGIPIRVGRIQAHYPFWLFNRFIVQGLRRRKKIHEAERILEFLQPLGHRVSTPREKLWELIQLRPCQASPKVKALLDPQNFNLVIHPLVNACTLPWPKTHFITLLQQLPPHIKIFMTGAPKDAELFGDLKDHHPNVVNLFGELPLDELIDFLSLVDGLVVGSTGPLHIAAALGTPVIGLFPSQDKINQDRWEGLGQHSLSIEAPHCALSRKGKRCDCMEKITPEQVHACMQQHWGI